MREHAFNIVLTDEQPPANWSGTSGVSGSPEYAGLDKLPVALTERKSLRGVRDHVHLAIFDGTMLAQWWGRARNGHHYPFGRIMKIVPSNSGDHPDA